MAKTGKGRIVELLLSPRGHCRAGVVRVVRPVRVVRVVAGPGSATACCGVQQCSCTIWRVHLGLRWHLFMACFVRVGRVSRWGVARSVAVAGCVRRGRADGVVRVARVVVLRVAGAWSGHVVAHRSVLGVLLLVREQLPLVELPFQLVHGRRRERSRWRRVVDCTRLRRLAVGVDFFEKASHCGGRRVPGGRLCGGRGQWQRRLATASAEHTAKTAIQSG